MVKRNFLMVRKSTSTPIASHIFSKCSKFHICAYQPMRLYEGDYGTLLTIKINLTKEMC